MPEIPDRLVKALAGRYRLDRQVGQGSMATVYLAEELKHMNADGTGLRMLTDDAGLEFTPLWSPDRILIAVRTQHAGNWDVAVVDSQTGEMRVLTTPQNNDVLEDWTPDGNALLVTSGDYSQKLVTVRVDGLLRETTVKSKEADA